jgi:hypothetical protein
MNSILEINNLTYQLPQTSCAGRQIQKTRTFAFPSSYTDIQAGTVIPIVFNTGSAYIDGRQSSLNFTLKCNVGALELMKYFAFDFGGAYENSGASILNLISEIYLESRDGSILYRQNYTNIMQTVREYKISIEKKNMLTLIGGANDNTVYFDGVKGSVFPNYRVNLENNFNIPLSSLCPFFNTSNLLLPELIAGLKLTLVFAKPKNNIVAIDNNFAQIIIPENITFDISNVSLYLHQVDLYDGVQSVLRNSLIQSKEGLKFPFYCHHNSRFRPESTNFTYDVQLSCQNISYVAIKFYKRNVAPALLGQSPIAPRSIFDLSGQLNDENSLGFSVRAKLNNQYYPSYAILSATEAYINTCQALNSISYSDTDDIDVLKNINKLSCGVVPYSSYCYNKHNDSTELHDSGQSKGGFIIAIDLQKSNNISLSGVQTSQGKTISIEIQGLKNYDRIDLYTQVEYLSIVSVTENNCIISK